MLKPGSYGGRELPGCRFLGTSWNHLAVPVGSPPQDPGWTLTLTPMNFFNHHAVHALWQPSTSTRRAVLENIMTKEIVVKECDILLSGVGTFNNWKRPDISRLEKFKWPVLHAANWDEKVDLDGKKVAVIGNGASAVQVVPAIQPSESWNGCVRPPAADFGFGSRVQVADPFQNTIEDAVAYVLRWEYAA